MGCENKQKLVGGIEIASPFSLNGYRIGMTEDSASRKRRIKEVDELGSIYDYRYAYGFPSVAVAPLRGPCYTLFACRCTLGVMFAKASTIFRSSSITDPRNPLYHLSHNDNPTPRQLVRWGFDPNTNFDDLDWPIIFHLLHRFETDLPLVNEILFNSVGITTKQITGGVFASNGETMRERKNRMYQEELGLTPVTVESGCQSVDLVVDVPNKQIDFFQNRGFVD
ncbi:MAG: hypothetical protein U0525_00140 [Patescibacteria group bacterium]